MSKNQDTKLCKKCKQEIPKKASVCSKCGAKQGVKKLPIIIGIIVIIGIIGTFSGDKSATNTTENTQTEQKVEKKEPIVVSAAEMTALLEENALKAEKKYQDQYVQVTGRISVIDSDGDYISIVDSHNEYAIMGVQCHIKNEDQLNKVMELSKGQEVTITGNITSIGEVLGYSMDIDEIK